MGLWPGASRRETRHSLWENTGDDKRRKDAIKKKVEQSRRERERSTREARVKKQRAESRKREKARAAAATKRLQDRRRIRSEHGDHQRKSWWGSDKRG